MKNAFLLTVALATLLLTSCNQEKKSAISINRSQISKDSDGNITVRDYMEEANSIKGEAEEIIVRAKEINCIEAKKAAEKAIVISKIAETNSSILRVEHFIETASKTLEDAEEAITYCEDKNEINFTSELKEEK